MSETVKLFGIPVAKVTEGEAAEQIVKMAREGRASAPHRASLVATLNVDFVANAVSGKPFGGNDERWGYLKGADLVTADGMPIVLLSKLVRNPLPERVTGADLVPVICRRFAEEGLSAYVLGGDREDVETAFSKMPPVKVAGIDTYYDNYTSQYSILKHIDRALAQCIRQWYTDGKIPKHQTLGLEEGYTEVILNKVRKIYIWEPPGYDGDTIPCLTPEMKQEMHKEAVRKENERR